MKVFEFIDIVAAFHSYMMHGHTGDATTFSEKLGISRASLYRLIDDLQDYGIHIEYSRERQTYRYVFPERVQISLSIRELSEEEYEKNRTNVVLSQN